MTSNYTELTEQTESTFKKFGKSFYFASIFLPQKKMRQISELYSFCRYVDDCADELEPSMAQKKLQEISQTVEQADHSTPLGKLCLKLFSYGVQKKDLHTLISGAQFDLSDQSVQSPKDLIQYCYKVAGVVGLMVNPILGVKNPKAYPFSIDLGIAMQLTNICRDIDEDAQRGRLYLPMEVSESPRHTLKERLKSHPKIKIQVSTHLKLADQYYKSSFTGFAYLPLRARFVILVASEVYRAIGKKIKKNKYEVFNGRTYLNKNEKIMVTLKSLIKIFHYKFWIPLSHQSQLHQYLSKEQKSDLS